MPLVDIGGRETEEDSWHNVSFALLWPYVESGVRVLEQQQCDPHSLDRLKLGGTCGGRTKFKLMSVFAC